MNIDKTSKFFNRNFFVIGDAETDGFLESEQNESHNDIEVLKKLASTWELTLMNMIRIKKSTLLSNMVTNNFPIPPKRPQVSSKSEQTRSTACSESSS